MKMPHKPSVIVFPFTKNYILFIFYLGVLLKITMMIK